jgi:hypothetical protein
MTLSGLEPATFRLVASIYDTACPMSTALNDNTIGEFERIVIGCGKKDKVTPALN